MVRNSELPEMGQASKEVASIISDLIETRELSQTEIGKIIGRGQSYASLRIKGMKSWTVEELDALAPSLGFDDFFSLMRYIKAQMKQPQPVSQTISVDGMQIPVMDLAAKYGDTLSEQEGYIEEP